MRTNAVAVAALTGDRHAGEVYELTGPGLFTFADAVGEIAQAAHLTAGVQRALGREPKDFADYTRCTARTGVWQVAA